MTDRPGFEPIETSEFAAGLPDHDLDDAVRAGEISADQAAEQLQQAARRHATEQGPVVDTDADGLITIGGFGSGRGMEKPRTDS